MPQLLASTAIIKNIEERILMKQAGSHHDKDKFYVFL